MKRDIDRKVQIWNLDPRVHKENDNLVKEIETQFCDTENINKAKEEEKKMAERMRKTAIETMRKRKQIAGDDDNEVKPKKRRSNGSDTLMYLKERNESLEKCRMQELEMKRKELEFQEKRHDDFMKMMAMQQQQQAKQMQDFQAMMLTIITK